MRPFTPPSMAPPPSPNGTAKARNSPRRDDREPEQAEADERDRRRQDEAPAEPLGQHAAAHRAPDVGQRR